MKNNKNTKIFFVLILFFALIFTISFRANAKNLKVLFIGNSYTYVNNLPQLISGLATSTGDQLIHSSSTPGGHTFEQHVTNNATLSLIAQGDWDFVVLQEQSQRPSFPDAQVEQDVYPYAKELDSLVKAYNPCAKTVFYMTWGRKNGDQDNCPFYPPVCTYEGMDDLLVERYAIMSQDNDAVLCPVAKVWREIRDNVPALELYDQDQSHPSINGSYAAACAFYALLFGKDPTNCTFQSTLNSNNAGIIRTAAKLIVFDNLDTWYQFSPALQADFTNTITSSQVNFNNTSINANAYVWDFGDGGTSTQQNPTHNYSAIGNYQVKLVANKCGHTDTTIKQVQISAVGIETVERPKEINLYPNPARDVVHIPVEWLGADLSISDVTGRVITEYKSIQKTVIGLDGFRSGIYMVKLEKGALMQVSKLVIGTL